MRNFVLRKFVLVLSDTCRLMRANSFIISLIERRDACFFHLLLATRFPLDHLSATHFRADWLPMVEAWQPSGLNY